MKITMKMQVVLGCKAEIYSAINAQEQESNTYKERTSGS